MPSEMYNPAHPGLVLRDYLEGHKITSVAKHIGVSRVTLSKILNCRTGITAEMSLRLSAALGNHSQLLVRYAEQLRYGASEEQKTAAHPCVEDCCVVGAAPRPSRAWTRHPAHRNT